MPRGNERHRDSHADIYPTMPIVGFGSDCRIVVAHDGVSAERRDDACGMCCRNPRQSGEIEMIIMAMRHQHDIDWWQICKGDAWIVDTFRPNEPKRRRALRPHRVK